MPVELTRRVGVIPFDLARSSSSALQTGLYRLGEAYLVVLGEQRILTDIGEIQP